MEVGGQIYDQLVYSYICFVVINYVHLESIEFIYVKRSVRASVMHSVTDSVMHSVMHSVMQSVMQSVMYSVVECREMWEI
jgi:phosphoribulokinase